MTRNTTDSLITLEQLTRGVSVGPLEETFSTRNTSAIATSRLRSLGLTAALLFGLALANAGVALAHWSGPTPPALPPTVGKEQSFTGENPSCGDLSNVPFQYEYKIEDPAKLVDPLTGLGSFDDPGEGPLVVDLNVRNTDDYGWLLDWVKNSGTQINAVIMKGGANSGGNYYFYENQPPNVTQDANLHAALNRNKAQGISHVTFCYSLEETEASEGCTLGYWKNHPESWPQPYGTGMLLSVAEFVGAPKPSDTLLAALLYKGGPKLSDKINLLLKQGVAALLSAAHPDVDYPLTPEQVLVEVNAAIATGDQLLILGEQAKLNGLNNAGCPLN